jgi:hypothetical protein
VGGRPGREALVELPRVRPLQRQPSSCPDAGRPGNGVTALVISDHVCENNRVARRPGGGRCASRGRAV